MQRTIAATLLLVLMSVPAFAQDSRILAFQFGVHSDSAKPVHRNSARQAYTHAQKRKASVRASQGVKQSPFPKQFHERVWEGIAKPSRYIGGRLICMINVNAALAERGIKGTGSAMASSVLRWGRPSGPVPGAVAFNYRRGGSGHTAIVSHVDARGNVWVWNPSPRGQGWQLRVNRYASVYRVPS